MSPARRSYNLAPTPATDRADDWRDSALCIGVDPEWFFVDGSKWALHPADEARAKAICADCPVVAECLAFAIKRGDKDSVAGGLTPKERDALIRKPRRPSTRGAKPAMKCVNGHDTSQPGSRLPNRDCRQCARDRSARQRAKQKKAQAS